LLTRICLLLLSLTTCNALAEIKSVDYKVVNSNSPLYRKVDLKFSCPMGGAVRETSSSAPFVLETAPIEEGVRVSITFSGKGIKVVQELTGNQKVTSAVLNRLEPLSGKVISSMELPVNLQGSTAKIEAKNLQNGKYTLVYVIQTSESQPTLIAPKVEVLTEGEKVQTEAEEGQGEEAETLTFIVPVFFAPGEYTINYKNRALLDGLKPLVEYCDVDIIGYANGTPIVKTNVDSNQELAKKRAEAVKNYLEGEE